MKWSLLFLFVMVVVVTEVHGGPGQCEAERSSAAPGDWLPVCTNKGKYKNKQCNDDICWCVTKRKGRPNYKKQQVPLGHYYDCKRKPKMCLLEQLSILLDEKNKDKNPWVPDCESSMEYQKKQCVPVACEKRRKRGVASCPTNYIGNDVVDRENVDSEDFWTFVSAAEFASDGVVTGIELFVKQANGIEGKLKVGIYRPQGSLCEFNLLKEVVLNYKDLTVGKQEIMLVGPKTMKVNKGDRYGFSWTGGEGGVIAYENLNEKWSDQFCEDKRVLKKGDVAELVSGRNGNRRYSILLQMEPECPPDDVGFCEGAPQALGFPVIDRVKIDTADFWTMVSKDAFADDGEIRSFEIYVAGPGRALRVGIYRPTGGGECEFKLKAQREWTGFKEGVVKIGDDSSVLFSVQKGDRYGFTWLNFGVIAWDGDSKQNYCEKNAVYDKGDTANLDMTHGDRLYSIRFALTACGEMTTPAPSDCKECYCVDPQTGKEEEGTRTTDEMECD